MVIIVNKDSKIEEVKEALKKLLNSKKKILASFYGKLKGFFGDGLAYQKAIRHE
jgi:hypothetical protein